MNASQVFEANDSALLIEVPEDSKEHT